jgi:PKHD-type hydroxylase
MLITVPNVLAPEQVAAFGARLEHAQWADGRDSAGYLSQSVKNNAQLADTDPLARELGDTILRTLEKNSRFFAAALPLKVLPPLFNRYAGEQAYGRHIDGAIRPVAGTHHRVRTDLSATLFLCAPESYDGGELVIQDTFGERSIKLAAGDLVLYPGTSVHRVTPVTRGVRLAAFFWIQSMVRDATQRSILFELDNAIQRLAKDVPAHGALVDLAGVYHNLLRAWADA